MAFQQIVLHSWSDIHKHDRHGWVYRGQRSVGWELQTSIERCCDRHKVAPADRIDIERELFREFRRTYHHYSSHVPAADSVLEWLSVMQHHGAPTRLLDFTYSIYVAAYFGLEAADSECAVWALNGPWALQRSMDLLAAAGKPNIAPLKEPFQEGHERLLEEVFFKPPFVMAACPLNPFRLNERLRIQKGAFLVPADITGPFADNLRAMPGHDDAGNVIQIVIPIALREVAVRQLFNMNISRTSLFPGLDGFAQSLGVHHPAFNPVKWAP